jgi:hypothetical protein
MHILYAVLHIYIGRAVFFLTKDISQIAPGLCRLAKFMWRSSVLKIL